MAIFTTTNCSIDAIVSCVPTTVVKTSDYSEITESEQQLFTKTTGIIERRVANSNTTCSDLCFEAASDILEKFKCKDAIDILIFVSQSPDYFLPATAIILQHKLGLSKNCIAFDVSLGCSGYVYGLSIIANMLQSGQLKKALVLVGDKSTISTSFTDKSTYPLFGDAGTATLISYQEGSKPWHFNLQSDGSGEEAIKIRDGHSRYPYSESSEKLVSVDLGILRAPKHLALDGMEVFNFALREAVPNIKSLLTYAQVDAAELDYLVLHQANKLINESVRKKMKVEPEKVPFSIDLFGNTSSASIPLTICHALKMK